MVFLGEISFSFYLVHVIVFNYVEARWRMLSGLTPTELFVLVLLLTLSASTLLFYLVETPFRRLGQTPLRVCLGDAGRALRGMPVLVSALILIAGGSFFVGIPKRPHLSEDHLFPLRTLPLDIEQTVDDIALSEARLHLSDSGLCLDMAWDFEDVSAGHAQNRFLLVSRAGVPRLRVRPRTIIGSNNQASQVAVVDRICLGRDFRPNRDLLDAEDDTIAPLRFDFRITGRAVPNQRVAFILDPASLTLVQVPPS